MQRETMAFDLVIVGAGPSGLATAIQYAKICHKNNTKVNVCVVEKGSEVGAHILSGVVMEPRALNELIPDWADKDFPMHTMAQSDEFLWLSKKGAKKLPTPPQMRNEGNIITSLSQVCRWLAKQAEDLGVDIYPGFAASELVVEGHRVVGIQLSDQGLNKEGEQKPGFEPGMILKAKQVVLAEGARGSLTEKVIHKYKLREHAQPQTYAIGLKEVWEIDPEKHKAGHITHTIGWPLDPKTYGGSFIYHWGERYVSIGLVIGLDYQNPYLNPYEEFQQLKRHPKVNALLQGGRVLSYGARALNEGGWQSIPQLHFPGGVLVGCGPGFMNVPKIKGSHTAMKSGMMAAESLYEAITTGREEAMDNLTPLILKSWVGRELKRVRNIRPAFHKGLKRGLLYSALDTYVFKGRTPWTFKHQVDHKTLKPAAKSKKLEYPKPDGKITFDKLTSVSRTNVFHEEDQPCHLVIKDKTIPTSVNLKIYDGPESRYCPAGVYEYVTINGEVQLQINAQNCIHCKTCDIKDPKQNIEWTTPEGGGGPSYALM